MARALKPCGTSAAYYRHLRNREVPCEPCRQALNAEMRARRDGSFVPPKPQPCGTPAAYHRHLDHGEETCRPCKDAVAAYYRQRRAEVKAGAS